jgi:hypothetical protein
MIACVVATGVVKFMLGRDEPLGITFLMRECDGLVLGLSCALNCV